MPNNRQRGKYGERSARDAITQYWGFPDVHRTAQTSAKVSGADLGGTGGVHVEVKLRKALAVEAPSVVDEVEGHLALVVGDAAHRQDLRGMDDC